MQDRARPCRTETQVWRGFLWVIPYCGKRLGKQRDCCFGSRGSPVQIRPPRLIQDTARQAVTKTAYAALFSLGYVDGVRCVPHRSTRTLGPTYTSASEDRVASGRGGERPHLPIRRAGSGGVAGLGSEDPAVRSTRPKTSPNVPHLRTPPRITDRSVNSLQHIRACSYSRRGPFRGVGGGSPAAGKLMPKTDAARDGRTALREPQTGGRCGALSK